MCICESGFPSADSLSECSHQQLLGWIELSWSQEMYIQFTSVWVVGTCPITTVYSRVCIGGSWSLEVRVGQLLRYSKTETQMSYPAT